MECCASVATKTRRRIMKIALILIFETVFSEKRRKTKGKRQWEGK